MSEMPGDFFPMLRRKQEAAERKAALLAQLDLPAGLKSLDVYEVARKLAELLLERLSC